MAKKKVETPVEEKPSTEEIKEEIKQLNCTWTFNTVPTPEQSIRETQLETALSHLREKIDRYCESLNDSATVLEVRARTLRNGIEFLKG